MNKSLARVRLTCAADSGAKEFDYGLGFAFEFWSVLVDDFDLADAVVGEGFHD